MGYVHSGETACCVYPSHVILYYENAAGVPFLFPL